MKKGTFSIIPRSIISSKAREMAGSQGCSWIWFVSSMPAIGGGGIVFTDFGLNAYGENGEILPMGNFVCCQQFRYSKVALTLSGCKCQSRVIIWSSIIWRSRNSKRECLNGNLQRSWRRSLWGSQLILELELKAGWNIIRYGIDEVFTSSGGQKKKRKSLSLKIVSD